MQNDIIAPENLVYTKPRLMNDTPMHYCAGCSHGVVHKLVAEIIEEMGMADKAVGVSPVGCAVFAYRYIDIDWQEALLARPIGIHISGRRRPRRDRHRRDSPHAKPWGKHPYNIHQQCHIWHDRRADGANNPHRTEDKHVSLWTRPENKRLSSQYHRHGRHA